MAQRCVAKVNEFNGRGTNAGDSQHFVARGLAVDGQDRDMSGLAVLPMSLAARPSQSR